MYACVKCMTKTVKEIKINIIIYIQYDRYKCISRRIVFEASEPKQLEQLLSNKREIRNIF